jgi:hypothetical protein
MSQKLLKQNNSDLVEFEKLYEFRLNSEYTLLSETAVESIGQAILVDYTINGKPLEKPFPIKSFLNEIRWCWMDTRGTLAKRLGKWLKDNLEFTLTDGTKTAVGNIVREHLAKDKIYHIDFTRNLTWPAGNFGDHSSCFMGTDAGRRDIPKEMMRDPRFAAMRFFKRSGNQIAHHKDDPKNNYYYTDENYYHQGISRAFLCFDSYVNEDKKASPVIIVFNGYGLTTNLIADVLSSFVGLASRKIDLSNNNHVSGGLYINSHGIAISDNSILDLFAGYDFGMKWKNEATKAKEFKSVAKISADREKDFNYSIAQYSSKQDRFLQNILNGLPVSELEKQATGKSDDKGLMDSIPDGTFDIEALEENARQWGREDFEVMFARQNWGDPRRQAEFRVQVQEDIAPIRWGV